MEAMFSRGRKESVGVRFISAEEAEKRIVCLYVICNVSLGSLGV
jgi:hypothetical protein